MGGPKPRTRTRLGFTRRLPAGVSGLTLVELLVVLGIIGLLGVVLILALNPGRHGAQARNVQRRADVLGIAFALKQYAAANNGRLPTGIDATTRMLGTDASGCNIRCGAGTVTSTTVDLLPTADTYLDEAAPTSTNGGAARMQVYPWEPNWTKRSLIHFDLSGIPANAMVGSAVLHLFEAGTYGSTRTIGTHRLTRSWTEAGASWQRSDGTTPWTTPGGDFVPSPDATTTLSWDGVLGWFQWDLTSAVQTLVTGGSANNGWLLKDTVEDSSQAYWFFETKEGQAANRPFLRSQYDVDGATPTASSCLDLRSTLTPRYLVNLPEDPRYGTPGKTQYAVRLEAGRRVTVMACQRELNTPIQTTQ